MSRKTHPSINGIIFLQLYNCTSYQYVFAHKDRYFSLFHPIFEWSRNITSRELILALSCMFQRRFFSRDDIWRECRRRQCFLASLFSKEQRYMFWSHPLEYRNNLEMPYRIQSLHRYTFRISMRGLWHYFVFGLEFKLVFCDERMGCVCFYGMLSANVFVYFSTQQIVERR